VLASRFFVVSVTCALLHNALMVAGDWLGWHYAASSVASFAIVAAFGYWMHSAWTFPGAQRSAVTFARYAGSMSLNLPAFIFGMYLAVDLGGMPVVMAAPVVTVLLWAMNFAATRWALRA
jgi:putative flippase GtrA